MTSASPRQHSHRQVPTRGEISCPTYRQAITAAGSGCAAALDAEHYLRDREPEGSDGEVANGQEQLVAP